MIIVSAYIMEKEHYGVSNKKQSYILYSLPNFVFISPLVDLKVICTGTPGHGSLLHENTAGEKLQYMINKFMNWREYEKLRMKNCNFAAGDITSINLTMLNGGCQINVVPPELTVGFDVRLSVDINVEEIENTVNKWCKEAGEGVRIEFFKKSAFIQPTKIDENNPWWVAFKKECDKM